MPYSTPASAVAATVATAAFVNTNYRDNLIAINAGYIATLSQVQGAVPYGSSSSRLVSLAPGTSGQVLTTRGPSANPVWGPSPVAMALLFG